MKKFNFQPILFHFNSPKIEKIALFSLLTFGMLQNYESVSFDSVKKSTFAWIEKVRMDLLCRHCFSVVNFLWQFDNFIACIFRCIASFHSERWTLQSWSPRPADILKIHSDFECRIEVLTINNQKISQLFATNWLLHLVKNWILFVWNLFVKQNYKVRTVHNDIFSVKPLNCILEMKSSSFFKRSDILKGKNTRIFLLFDQFQLG